MNIPLYWVRATGQVPGPNGRRFDLTAWGWSSIGRAEAEQKAHERLASVAQRVQQGLEFPRGYGYGERPLREEILSEVQNREGEVTGIVTRNSYGSLVLKPPIETTIRSRPKLRRPCGKWGLIRHSFSYAAFRRAFARD